MAAETRVSRQSIYRLLNGDNPISYHRSVSVLTALGVDKAEREKAVEVHHLAEVAVQRRLGGTAAWREQLDHLLTMSEAENITIQVLPFAAGAHETVVGQIPILSFPEAATPRAGGADL